MNPGGSGTSQERKSKNYLKSDYRSKLNPRKKAKDTQNYKPKYSFDTMSENSSLISTVDSTAASNCVNKESESEMSKEIIQSIDDEASSRPSFSGETIQISSAGSLGRTNSIASSNTAEIKDIKAEVEALPSKLWWVPPLKTPSTYKPPSLTMSSKSYSAVSSISRPKIIRSAEDLRKKVISQCNLMEAAGYEKYKRNKEEVDSANSEHASSNDLCWVPPLNLPGSHQTQTTASAATVQSVNSKLRPSKSSLLRNPTVVLHQQANLDSNTRKNFTKKSDVKLSANTIASRRTLRSSKRLEDFGFKKLFSNQSVQYEDITAMNGEPYFTMGDIARKHIVNPIATKLARLCTKQGQLYVEIIDDLERSCKEFESVCKNRALQKKY